MQTVESPAMEVLADLWSSRGNFGLTWTLEDCQDATDTEITQTDFDEFNGDLQSGLRCRFCACLTEQCGCEDDGGCL